MSASTSFNAERFHELQRGSPPRASTLSAPTSFNARRLHEPLHRAPPRAQRGAPPRSATLSFSTSFPASLPLPLLLPLPLPWCVAFGWPRTCAGRRMSWPLSLAGTLVGSSRTCAEPTDGHRRKQKKFPSLSLYSSGLQPTTSRGHKRPGPRARADPSGLRLDLCPTPASELLAHRPATAHRTPPTRGSSPAWSRPGYNLPVSPLQIGGEPFLP